MNLDQFFDAIFKFKLKFKQKDLRLEDSISSWIYNAASLTSMWLTVAFFIVTALYLVFNQYLIWGNIFVILSGLSIYMILPFLNMKWHFINTLGVSLVAGNFMGLLVAGAASGPPASIWFYLIPVIIGMIFGACLIYTADKFRNLEIQKQSADENKARAAKYKTNKKYGVDG